MLYPVLGGLFTAIGILVILWLIVHVELGREFSYRKTIASIILLSILLGFGMHFIMLTLG
ncbi:MAG: hypothetical protein ACFE7E_07965 [Candidatus Hodarchaeota archaeon]